MAEPEGDALDSIPSRLDSAQAESLHLLTVPVQLYCLHAFHFVLVGVCEKCSFGARLTSPWPSVMLPTWCSPPPHGCCTSTSRQPALIATDPGEEAACPSLSSEAWTCACVAWGQGCLPWQVSPALTVGPELPGVWSGTS